MNVSQAMVLLGLAKDAGESEIRRAYAQRLKTTHPEDDPEGFKELRQAYEAALNWARYRQQVSEDEAEDDGVPDAADVAPTMFASEGGEPASAGQDQAHEEPADADLPPDDRAAHGALCNRLAEALSNHAGERELRAALEAVLGSPALANVDVYNQTEIWLINLLARTPPASYPLLDRAIQFFRWEDKADHRNRGPGYILSLRSRIPNEKIADAFLARVKDKRHEFNRAYRQLLDTPESRSWLARIWALRYGDVVERFVVHIQQKAPLAIEALNPEAVDWWRRHRGGPWPWLLGLGAALTQTIGLGVVAFAALMLAKTSGLLPDYDTHARATSQWVDARADCEDALEEMRAKAADDAIGKADSLCRPELAKAPDSLLLMQHLAEIELAAGRKAAALSQFDRILARSPNDPFALFGKGLAASDPALLSEAVARSSEVMKHYIALPVGIPAVPPMDREPKSRWEAPRTAIDTPGKRISQISDDQMRTILRHFRRMRTPVGKAVLNCILTKTGVMSDCVILSEFPYGEGVGEIALQMAAVEKFEPARLAGQPVDARTDYTISLIGTAEEQARLRAAEEKANLDRIAKRGGYVAPPKPAASSSPLPSAAPPKPTVSEAMQRVLAREECDKLAETVRLGKAAGAESKLVGQADAVCRRELERAPESLVLRQHVALIALAAGKAGEAAGLFDEILVQSPNDPYALYGKGASAVTQDPSADASPMAEARKREPGVEAYFAHLGLNLPDVAPMAGDPQSHVAKRPVPKADTRSQRSGAADDGLMLKMLKHFGLRQSPVGKVVLNCLVRAEGRLANCVIAEEQPYNQGVGEFAMAMAYGEKFEPAKLNGEPVDNMPLSYTLQLVGSKEELDRLNREEKAGKPEAGAPSAGPGNPPTAP